MRRTSTSLLVLTLLALCAYATLFQPSRAQTNSTAPPNPVSEDQGPKQMAKLVRTAKNSGAVFEQRQLSQTENRLVQTSNQMQQRLATVLDDAVVFDLNRASVSELMANNVDFLTLSLPDGHGSTVDLDLIKVDIFAAGFSIKTAAPTSERLDNARGVHYRGIIKGNEQSLAAISIFNNEVAGFFSSAANGNSVIGRLGGDNPSDTHIVYAEQDLKVDREFSCATRDDGTPLPQSVLQAPTELPGQCIRIYIEADFDLFQNKGSVTATANYVIALFNQSATLFANDGLSVTISEILVWNVQSPYAGLTTSSAILSKFQQIRTSFNGDFGHLLAVRNTGGIAATINGYCASAAIRECYSGIDPFFSSVPTYSWSVEVFTHELGHLFGSPHTHACVWNGNNTSIDGCGPSLGFFEGSCSQAPIPPNGGTVMSYCHLTGVGINFTFGFGPQPRSVMANRLANATCLTSCGFAIGQGAPNQQLFVDAANRSGFLQFAKQPPLNVVHRWNCGNCDPNNPTWGKGLIQDFEDVTPGVHDALMLADTNTNFVAQIYGGMWDKFFQLGALEYNFANSRMIGYPLADRNCSDVNQSCFTDAQLVSSFATSYHYQRFQGAIFLMHRSGARNGQTFEIHGPIRARWDTLQGPTGTYGLPISDEYAFNSKRRSDFEGGSICFNPATNQTEDDCAGIPPTPVAQPATNVANTSFTANWGSSTGATGYRLDVSTSSTFSTFVTGFQNLDVGNVLSRNVTGLTAGTNYFYRVRAYTATGTSGDSNTIPVTTTGSSVQVTVQTNPTGRSFTVDGVTFTSAQTFSWVPGSSHTISTTTIQDELNGSRFSWSNWSDGGSISHSVSPTVNTTYTANFNAQFFLTMTTETGGTATPSSNWFNSGQIVTITGTPNAGVSFNGWFGTGNGSYSGFANPATVTMIGPITQKARFIDGPAAVYDPVLKAPRCGEPGKICDSGSLLNGRDTMSFGNEPNQPNTINNSCADGTSGSFHQDESLDHLRVSTVDESNFAPGKQIIIEASVWAFSASNALDLYYATDATNPNWVLITTIQATSSGALSMSAGHTIPVGGSATQAIRARFRFQGSASPCLASSGFDDHDDLIFAVKGINVALPANGGVASASSTFSNNYPASNVINGERAGANSNTGGLFNGWIGSTGTFPQWAQVDFGQLRSIQEIDVFTVQDNYPNPSPPTTAMTFSLYGLQGYEVQSWNGSSWATIPGANVTGNNKVWKQFTFPTISTSKIRVLTHASPDSYSRITEIEAWSDLSPPPSMNVALAVNGSAAIASSTFSNNYPASNTINGERAGANSTTGGLFNGWIGSTGTFPQSLQIEFGQMRSIQEIDVFTVQDNYPNPSPPTQDLTFSLYGLQGYEVQYWNGSTWVTISNGTVTGNNKVWKQFTFPTITTQRIRVLTSASPDSYSRITEVEAWSNSPPPSTINVALPANGGAASASSTYSNNYPASNAINGERAGGSSTTGGLFNGWIGSTGTFPQWLQVDFGQVRNIQEIDVFTVQDNYQNPSPPTLDLTFSLYGLQGYEVQYWNGSSWITIPGGNVTGNNKAWKQFTFATISTQRIRVLTNASPDSYSRVTEIEAWSSSP
ncbi:MAG TPA: discoidin domain-containing protein [Pyrinomonadaceae bacterium]|nr:discoidin domain-containing protein [Pyrinomonadaceae bacterium]